MNLTVEEISQSLKNAGIRPSYQRIKVLEYLYQKGGHPTVEEIYRALSQEIPSLSKVTIYNTLHTFVEEGLTRVVDIDESEMRYDVTLSNHGHFLCESCGTIYNFDADVDLIPIKGLEPFDIRKKNIYFKGLCPNCNHPQSKLKQEN